METVAFTAVSLVAAVRTLFELNHYEVEGPTKLHGAEVDLIARRKTDPFSTPVFIEATIEYVGNDKYGKDLTKFMLIRETVPDAQLLIISSEGFSLPVKERASASRVKTLTYAELFSQFERFEAYVTYVTGDSSLARELTKLEQVYEEPLFEDKLGSDKATSYLLNWRDTRQKGADWLVIVGEYGTGKTALTKIIQYRWMKDYQRDPSLPIPLRIELRDFSRQFDARGLLHHFLDNNNLGNIPLDFVYSLITHGRAILILDGYDEMAQYLLARERRACLEALAELSREGARGILTSRPSYFTITEELQMFEVLYTSLKTDKFYIGRETRELLNRESMIDRLLEQFIDRFERSLQDLTPEQTEKLVERILSHDEKGQKAVLEILRRVFRSAGSGDSRSLSGKPVIVSYLLEIVEDLKGRKATSHGSVGALTEWQVYKLILDHLMLRDFRRVPEIEPGTRRHFLHRLSIFLSRADHPQIAEGDFRDLVSKEFVRELRRQEPEARAQQIERYFADLRSSATLTRSSDSERSGWRFSHNSLREYLLAEYLLVGLQSGSIAPDLVPISDAMRLFAASQQEEDLRGHMERLANHWGQRGSMRGSLGQLLTLLWDGLLALFISSDDPVNSCLCAFCGNSIALNGLDLNRLQLSSIDRPSDLSRSNFSDTNLVSMDFSGARLETADFSFSIFDAVSFADTELRGARFDGGTFEDVNFSGAKLKGAVFQSIQAGDISILVEGDGPKGLRRLEGLDALGFLNYAGAITDPLPPSAVLKHHPKFTIVAKISEKLAEQAIRQRRGIEQRGEARKDVRFSRKFVNFLESQEWIKVIKRRSEMVEVTDRGREIFKRFTEGGEIPVEIVEFLSND